MNHINNEIERVFLKQATLKNQLISLELVFTMVDPLI